MIGDTVSAFRNAYNEPMPTRAAIEYVHGELLRDGVQAYKPKLKLTVNEITPDERLQPVKRILVSHELSQMTGMVIEDGEYTLRYMFDGKWQEHPVFINHGMLFAAKRKK